MKGLSKAGALQPCSQAERLPTAVNQSCYYSAKVLHMYRVRSCSQTPFQSSHLFWALQERECNRIRESGWENKQTDCQEPRGVQTAQAEELKGDAACKQVPPWVCSKYCRETTV